MGPIHQRFEVEQPAAAAYQAIAAPESILRTLPGVTGVTQLLPNRYRLDLDSIDAPREIMVETTRHDELRRLEWQTMDGAWSGAVTVEPIGPARSAVGVHAESASPEALSPSATRIHDTLQAFKRRLESPEIKISRGRDVSYDRESLTESARRYASEWRSNAQSALTRPAEYPFALMRTVSQQADRLLGQMWRGTPLARLPQMMPGLPWNPSVEVCEQDDQVRVALDVPGVEESSLQVEITDGELIVRGERQDERSMEPGRRRSEVRYGTFTRRIPLPEGADPDGARANLRNGVLEVRIPLHRREPRRVPVQHVS
jgi:HSP20 family molecular chaperone IbpA